MRPFPVYLISLPQAVERRHFQRRQLDRLGLHHIVADAVDIPSSQAWRGHVPRDRWERPLMATEYACFLSHYVAWQWVEQHQTPVLILEDDVLLSSRLRWFMDRVAGWKGVEHLSLETRLRKKMLGSVETVVDGIGVARMYQDRTGAAAYILWPEGAKKLLASTHQKGAALADAFMANHYGLKSYQSVPALAIQSDTAAEYGIVSGLSTRSYIQTMGLAVRASDEDWRQSGKRYRRIWAQFRMARRFLRAMWVAKRQFVRPDPVGFDYVENGLEKKVRIDQKMVVHQASPEAAGGQSRPESWSRR